MKTGKSTTPDSYLGERVVPAGWYYLLLALIGLVWLRGALALVADLWHLWVWVMGL